MPPLYELIVGNIGTVYRGYDRTLVMREFDEYVELSKSNKGRAAGEPVTLMLDGEILKEHVVELA